MVEWLSGVDEDRAFISVVTLAELRYGVERMPAGARRKNLDRWLEQELPLRFEGRILTVNSLVADAWGKVLARSESVGRPLGAVDAFIAATANVYQLQLVTRNVSDFHAVVKTIVNPWT